VTKQAGIGRGYYSERDFLALTKWMCDRFEAKSVPIADVFYCPFHPENDIGKKNESFDRKTESGDAAAC